MLVLKAKRKGYQVRVIDSIGNIEVFDSVKEVAKVLEVKQQTIYQAICDGRTVRGCRIYKYQPETIHR